jgi:hypothetical protein
MTSAPDDAPRALECLEGMLPDTRLLETPKEALDDPVLFRDVGRDGLLLEAVVSTRLPEPSTVEDQAIVAP